MRKRFAGASVVAMLVAAALVSLAASGRAAGGEQSGGGDIGGVVTSANGPEEGVWVIAETTSLPTKFVKSVVTGDGGRYLIPDLPEAAYDVWVRGYGLVDSDRTTAAPGDTVDLTATVAETPAEAARVYPANYWYSLIRPPRRPSSPGSGAGRQRHRRQPAAPGPVDRHPETGLHAVPPARQPIIREIDNLAQFDSSLEAWNHRVQMGQRGGQMTNVMNRFRPRAGVCGCSPTGPTESQPAPCRRRRRVRGGIERNVVISMWELGYRDRLHPRRDHDRQARSHHHANGPVYGVNISNDALAILDPVTLVATNLEVPLRVDPDTVPGMIARSMPAPSRFFGDELIWNDHRPTRTIR